MNENWNFEEKLSHYRQPELWVKKFSRYIDMDTEGQGNLLIQLLTEIGKSFQKTQVYFDEEDEKYVLKAYLSHYPLRIVLDSWFCNYNIDIKWENKSGNLHLYYDLNKKFIQKDLDDPWEESREVVHFLDNGVYLEEYQEELENAIIVFNNFSDGIRQLILGQIKKQNLFTFYLTANGISISQDTKIYDLANPIQTALECIDFVYYLAGNLDKKIENNTTTAVTLQRKRRPESPELEFNMSQRSNEKMNSSSGFDIEKLTDFAIQEIKLFAESHPDETFYGFSIDESMLCFNSVESFENTLAEYLKNYPSHYREEENILDLKLNTGDWNYQGFAEFQKENGFDFKAYDEHYYANDEEQKHSDYAKAMDQILENLKKSDAFETLKKTDDFFITRVEHEY